MNVNLPSDNVIVPDPSATDDSASDVGSFSISPESPPIPMQETAPVEKSVETLIPEIGTEQLSQPEVEVPVPAVLVEEPVQEETPLAPVADITPAEHVVDKRKHSAGDNALKTTHKVTAAADAEEADFIDHVEEVHTIK
ncbi:hypothetical protein HN803_06390 [candidate division WWE3 bacterium]|jgi:hypothetical protein|nr:hypothetical protein [candidate division WWE3 bacterium]MBT7350385.1 hypothetical protein [candidate division WWE3 bacterium]